MKTESLWLLQGAIIQNIYYPKVRLSYIKYEADSFAQFYTKTRTEKKTESISEPPFSSAEVQKQAVNVEISSISSTFYFTGSSEFTKNAFLEI